MLKRRWMVCAAAVTVFTLAAGMATIASEEEKNVHAFSIDMTDENDEAWERIAMTNDDEVQTGLNIRDIASSDGLVIACMYRGGAVKVVHKGDEWTEVEVGDVTGFVKNEYLIYGTEAKGLAEYYGVYGVEASWDDVKVFEQPDANATIIHTAEAGEKFELLENQGHWQKVKFEDMEAYVSIEDVTSVILVDDLVILDEPYSTTEDTYADESYTDESYTDTGYDNSSSDSYNDYSNSGSSSSGNTGSSTSGSTGNSGSTGSSTDNSGSANTTPPATEPDTSVDDGEEDDDAEYDDGIYTDDTVVDTEDTAGDDSSDEYVEEIEDAEEYVEENAAANDTYTDESYTDDTYTDDTYTEETEAESASSSSDLDLMAAIIYCEAGNQSYEGMVAVGAVVMNRVYSASFPNTISEVIYQSGQFTPASSGTLASALASGVPSTCYDAAAAAMAGENPVGGALYFNGGSGSGTQIGDHQFY